MQRPSSRSAIPLLAMLFAALPVVAQEAVSLAPAPIDPLARPVEPMPLADQSLILDLARSGTRIIAVGERGHILHSDDGTTWTQSTQVPLRSTLTAVAAIGDQAWAVGHDGVILHSSDGGISWEIQRRDPRGQPAEGVDPGDPRQGAPLLDVYFVDAQNGFAIGAYSLFLHTSDGGAHWNGSRIILEPEAEPAEETAAAEEAPNTHSDNDFESSVFSADELEIGQESDPHLNAIARTGGGHYVIVGERGAVFRSVNGGATWIRSQLPYDGSMFGIIGFEDLRVLAFGLRGHVFESHDLGVNWNEIPSGSELSLMGGAALESGGAVIVGANGIVLRRADASAPLTRHTDKEAGVIAGVLPLDADGSLLTAGEHGLGRFQPE